MTGKCASLALALHELRPQLHFGLQYVTLDEEESRQVASDHGQEWDGEYCVQAEHVFLHDKDFFYDATGKHPLTSMIDDQETFSQFDLDRQRIIDCPLHRPQHTAEARTYLQSSNYLHKY